MSERDPLAGWMGEGDDAGGVEAETVLARLRQRMFEATDTEVRLGRYRELEEIGRGGMSVVYRARDEPIGRMVAIKLLRGDTSGQRARLQREARAMARLSHPNVVQVIEVGHHQGETYVVMELVRGKDAAAWLAETPRSWREILDVFLAAGEGLAAAHAEGLVHRDFKPSNVMVGDDGRVRVTDFGLAAPEGRSDTLPSVLGGREALAGSADERVTVTGARLGTPRYMAPEQWAGAQVDHRADQWAFAVSLWESLTHVHPFADAQGRIDPTRERLGPTPARGPVGAVVSVLERSLAVDPERRHPSMRALLDALRSRVDGPRLSVPTRVAASVLVVSAVATAWWSLAPPPGATRCDPSEHSGTLWTTERRNAVEQGFRATELPHAAQAWSSVDARIGPWIEGWNEAYARACEASEDVAEVERAPIDLTLACLRSELTEVRGLVDALTSADRALVNMADAATRDLPDHQRCIAPRTRDVDPQQQVAHTERMAEIHALVRAGRYAEAAELSKGAVQAVDDPVLRAEAEMSLGLNLRRSGDATAAVEPLRAAFYRAASTEDADLASRAALAMQLLAVLRSDYEDAERWDRHVSTWIERVTDDDDRKALQRERAMVEGELLHDQGHYDRSLTALQRAWGLCDEEPTHPMAPRLFNQMGMVHMARGDYDAAELWLRRALEQQSAMTGRSHPQVANALENLGSVHWYQGDYDAAERAYAEALEIRRTALGPDNPKTANTVMNLGLIDHVRGDHAGAVEKFERAIEAMRASLGPDHPQTALAIGNLAATLSDMGQWERSNARNREALEIYETRLGPDHPSVANALHNLASGMTEVGRYDEARALYERSLAIVEKVHGRSHVQYGSGLHNLAVLYRRLEDYAEAERLDREALAVYEASVGPDHPDLALVLVGLARNALVDARHQEAIALAERARAVHPTAAVTRGLAALYLLQGLAGASGDADGIGALVVEARRELEAAGPNGTDYLAELDEFVAREGL